MHFPVKFSRWVGGGGTPALGSDSAPTAAPSPLVDNQLAVRVSNVNGWPVQRIAVVCSAPALAPALPCTLYVYESTTGKWYSADSPVSITPGKVGYFDALGLSEAPQVAATLIENVPGGTVYALVATDPGGTPAGEYVFALAPDVTGTEGAEASTTVNVSNIPAASALSDADANPTTSRIGANMLGWSGAAWARVRAGVTGLTATVTGWLNVLPGVLYSAAPAARADGQYGPLQSDANGSLKIAPTDAANAVLFPSAAAQSDNLAGGSTTKISALAAALNNSGNWDRLRGSLANVSTNVVSTWTGVLHGLPIVRYAATPPTLADGQGTPAPCDVNGNAKQTMATLLAGEDITNNVIATVLQPLATNAHALSWNTIQAAASSIVKASAGTMYIFFGINSNAATRYIQCVDAATVPADGAVTFFVPPIPVQAGQTFSLDLTPFGKYFTAGFCIWNSTTLSTKTLGSADSYISTGYI